MRPTRPQPDTTLEVGDTTLTFDGASVAELLDVTDAG